MRFNVEISEQAEEQYDNILYHISEEFKNPQALIAIMDDYDETLSVLENSADSFPLCENERLKSQGFHKMLFCTISICLYTGLSLIIL